MIKLLKKSDYQTMSWKNGGGVTSQIKIFPENSRLDLNNFNWRLSTAEIHTSGPFSLFPHYKRLLVLWEGEGVLLNGRKIPPLIPLEFFGDEKIECALIGKKVSDLGLIFNEKKIKPQMKVLINPLKIQITAGEHFIFCSKGSFEANNELVEVGECLYIKESGPLTLQGTQEAVVIHIII